MTIKEIVASIKAKQPEIKTVYFVGCGASQSDLFPEKYFLENNAKKLRTSIYTANNFNYSTPAGVDDTAIVITCSLSGNTPETVAATKLAVEKGAHVVAVTHKADSALAQNGQYQIIHGFYESYGAKMEKPARGWCHGSLVYDLTILIIIPVTVSCSLICNSSCHFVHLYLLHRFVHDRISDGFADCFIAYALI